MFTLYEFLLSYLQVATNYSIIVCQMLDPLLGQFPGGEAQ